MNHRCLRLLLGPRAFPFLYLFAPTLLPTPEAGALVLDGANNESKSDSSWGPSVQMFSPDQIPIKHTLAKSFGVFNRYRLRYTLYSSDICADLQNIVT